MNEECLNRLKFGINMKGNNKGIVVSIESPKCCIDYAEFNVDRTVPLRQYFGKDIKLAKKFPTILEKIFTFNNQEINADIIKCRPKNGVNAIKKPTENPMEIEYEVSGIRINLFQKLSLIHI